MSDYWKNENYVEINENKNGDQVHSSKTKLTLRKKGMFKGKKFNIEETFWDQDFSKGELIKPERLVSVIVETLKLVRKDDILYSRLGGELTLVSANDLQGWVVPIFLDRMSVHLSTTLYAIVKNRCMTIEPFDESVVTFKNANYRITSSGCKEISRETIGKIRVNVNRNKVATEFAEKWKKFVDNVWHNDVNDVNRILSSCFFTRDIITKRRSIILWDSNGNAGKSTILYKMSKMFDEGFHYGLETRDYVKGQMGKSNKIDVRPVNILDDMNNFVLTDGFATDQTKNIFSIKSIGSDGGQLETYFTTIVLCNETENKLKTRNNLKRFDYVKTDNERLDENDEHMELIEDILSDMEMFMNYLFDWYIDNIGYCMKNNLMSEDAFNKFDAYAEAFDNLMDIKFFEKKQRKMAIMKACGFNKKEDKDLMVTYLEGKIKEGVLKKKKNGSSYQWELNDFSDMEIEIEEKVEVFSKNADVNVDTFEKLVEIGAVDDIITEGGYNKFKLSDECMVVDIEPKDKSKALSRETCDIYAKTFGCETYCYTNGGVHLFMKSSCKDCFKNGELGEATFEFKKSDIFIKEKEQYVIGKLVENDKIFSRFSKTDSIVSTADLSGMSLPGVWNQIKDYNCCYGDSFMDILNKLRSGIDGSRNNTLRIIYIRLCSLNVDMRVRRDMINRWNNVMPNPLSEKEMKTIGRD